MGHVLALGVRGTCPGKRQLCHCLHALSWGGVEFPLPAVQVPLTSLSHHCELSLNSSKARGFLIRTLIFKILEFKI